MSIRLFAILAAIYLLFILSIGTFEAFILVTDPHQRARTCDGRLSRLEVLFPTTGIACYLSEDINP